jgi:AcrR family transcriptional regulator
MNWKKGLSHPKQPRADATRNHILDTALEQFSQYGYHGTNTKKIAAAAGVATGSIYRYFKDKKTIFLAVSEHLEAEMKKSIFEAGANLIFQTKDHKAGLSAFIQFVIDSHKKNRRFHREVLAMAVLDEQMASIVKTREQRIRKKLMEFFESLDNPIHVTDLEAATELIHLTVEEVAHQVMLRESKVGEERLVAQLIEMLIKYLHV